MTFDPNNPRPDRDLRPEVNISNEPRARTSSSWVPWLAIIVADERPHHRSGHDILHHAACGNGSGTRAHGSDRSGNAACEQHRTGKPEYGRHADPAVTGLLI
jgi:hypothetical protein